MSKHIRFIVLALMLIGLTAGSAFAGTAYVNHLTASGNYTAATEAMGAARNVTLVGTWAGAGNSLGSSVTTTNLPVAYALGQTLSSGYLVSVSLSGAAFASSANLYVCAANGIAGGVVTPGEVLNAGGTAPAANSTSQVFTVTPSAGANVASGNLIWFSSSATCNAPSNGGTNLPIQITRTTAGSSTITISVLSGSTTTDAASTATLATVGDEFAGSLSAADTVTIDYLGTPGNGTQLTTASSANALLGGSNNKLGVLRTIKNLGAVNGMSSLGGTAQYGVVNAGGTTYLRVNMTDTQGWSAINRIIVMASAGGAGNVIAANATACSNASPTAALNSPSGTASINIPTGQVSGFDGGTFSGGTNLNICFQVDSSTTIPQRTIAGTYAIVVSGTGTQDLHTTTASSTWQMWNVNGYQALIPWVVSSDSMKTYCLINNGGSTNAAVSLDLLSTEAGSVSGLTGKTLISSLAHNTSELVVFGNQGVQDAAGNTLVSLSSLTAGNRYSAKITMSADPTLVTINCNQVDPGTGGKRPVPVLTNGTSTSYYKN